MPRAGTARFGFIDRMTEPRSIGVSDRSTQPWASGEPVNVARQAAVGYNPHAPSAVPRTAGLDFGPTVGSVEVVAIQTLPRRLPDERAHERGNDISPCLTARVHADRLGRNCGPVAARPLGASSYGGDSRQHQTENVGEPRVLSDSVLPLFHDRRGPSR